MTLEEVRAHFVAARNFVKSGDSANMQNIISHIDALSQYVKQIYKTASIMEQVQCRLQHESFEEVIALIKTNGIKDRKVLAFFGLSPSEIGSASFSETANDHDTNSKQNEAEPKSKSERSSEKPIDGASNSATAKEPKASSAGSKTPSAADKVPLENATKPAQTGVSVASDTNNAGGGEDVPTFDPQSLRGFIGQQHIVKALLKEIAIAREEGRKHLDNILLFGNPGLGKTTLIKLIAKELGVGYELLDCSLIGSGQKALTNWQDFFVHIGREKKPVVIALDEIHMLNYDMQSSLLTLLNDRVFVAPMDKNKHFERVPIEEFTFIAATTDDDKVLDTIKNRCLRLTFQLVDYTPEELKRIYKNKIAAKGLTVDDAALELCVPRSRGAMRYVNSIVEGLNNALYTDEGKRLSTHISLDVAAKYFKDKGINDIGLGAKDLEILNVLAEDPSGALSADVLSARVGLDTKKYISEYERYLIKIGFINVSAKGRNLTEKAIKYLASGGDEGTGSGVCPAPADVAEESVVVPAEKENKVESNTDDNGSGDSEPKNIIDDLLGN